jgi:hypothetical protein
MMNTNYTATTAKPSCLELPTPGSQKSTFTPVGTSSSIAVVVTTSTKNISIQQPKTGTTIKERIQMFGGEVPKPPLVQKRKEQLSKKWEKDAIKKVATHGVCGRTGGNGIKIADPRKVEWYTSPKSGAYRKRIALRRSAD